MNLLRTLKIITLAFSILVSTGALSHPQIKICLTGRVVENLQSYGQSFINAANLAEEHNDLTNKVTIKKYFFNNRPLEPIHIYSQMVRDGCAAIIGFEYLSDLLLAINEQKNDKIPIFTSYASSTNADRLPKNIFIFMPSYNFHAQKMLDYLHAHFNKLDDLLLITEINRDEMLKYKEVYTQSFDKQHIPYDTFDFLENDKDIEGKLQQFLNKKKYHYVFLLSGAIASAKVANLMNDHKTIFIGTETFGSSVSPTFFLRLKDKKIRSYFIRNLDYIQPSSTLSSFESAYTNKYHEKPTLLAAYTYDAMFMILNALKQHGTVDTKSLLHSHYSGVTGAYLKNNQFHRSNNHVILSINENGYFHEK